MKLKILPDKLEEVFNPARTGMSDYIKSNYRKIHPKRKPIGQLRTEFVNSVFESQKEYQKYVSEFEEGPTATIRRESFTKYNQLTGEDTSMGAISLNVARDYYAITRKIKPDVVVETGVCNGLSTTSILLAIHRNGDGELHSIDYPYRADEPLDEFRKDTFEKYGGAAIPSDKQPGWIVPNDLRGHWNLIIGKSQRELPKLVTELGSLDMFIHDSEHSHPCMMFEYELSYEFLNNGGIIISDDINWNDAFNIFIGSRELNRGKLSENVGYGVM
jgi:predicted O-methyltransferase YrrM